MSEGVDPFNHFEDEGNTNAFTNDQSKFDDLDFTRIAKITFNQWISVTNFESKEKNQENPKEDILTKGQIEKMALIDFKKKAKKNQKKFGKNKKEQILEMEINSNEQFNNITTGKNKGIPKMTKLTRPFRLATEKTIDWNQPQILFIGNKTNDNKKRIRRYLRCSRKLSKKKKRRKKKG